MANVVRVVRMIKTDQTGDKNNNKFWNATLYDNGDVLAEWGRVGKKQGELLTAGGGVRFLEKKIKEKLSERNGEIPYREIDIVGDASLPSAPVAPSTQKTDLKAVAKKQIKVASASKETAKLIDYLTEINVHNITSFSKQITYNIDTGLFSTPMGLITQAGIDAAREKLGEIYTCVSNQDYGSTLGNLTNDYMMIVPQNIGHKKLDLRDFWSGFAKIQAQNTVLDALQASLATASKPKAKDGKVAPDEPEEQVFNTELDVVADAALKKKVFDNYMAMRSQQHGCYNYKPVELWNVHIKPMRDAFTSHGKTMTNQIEGFHGTGAENVLSLLKTGFLVRPPPAAAIAGKMFGNGTYVAPAHVVGSATKALNYAIGNWTGRRVGQRTFMFLCDVGMGNFYIAPADLKKLPSGYDSCWAKKGYTKGWGGTLLNDECIVYKESQIDIKYLIEMRG